MDKWLFTYVMKRIMIAKRINMDKRLFTYVMERIINVENI